MQEVVIAGYLRTAQSRCRPNDPGRDWFHALRADELLALVLPELIKRSGVEPEEVDDFIVGSATGVGEQWTYGGRTPIFLANLPETIAAKFVDQQCGSAMAGAHIGFMEIAQGFADVVMVGGMEHMTRVPMGGTTTDRGLAAPNLNLFLAPEYRHWDMMSAMNMGLTAEKLFAQSGCTKQEMDEWAVRSHHRAAQAQTDGFFDGEILPVDAPQADGSVMSVTTDQAVRGDTTLEGLASLRPVFKKDGVITAGVSSPLNAAGTGMILMSKQKAQAKGIKPLATIRSIGFAGVDPTIMGQGPVPASLKALENLGMKPSDIDYWEINEAFAIVALNCIKELGLDPERVNVM
ncbi:MAG: acetyl-CoA C-acyltransferase, partial [Desulfarculaceae bacterium]|nr:acetyl-CoA C-acyltransferase [Desulfarculaceae bacterium]